jgi:phage tail sheath protein FI
VVEVETPPPGAEPSPEFTLRVSSDGAAPEEYAGVSVGKGTRAVDKVVNEASKLIRVQVKTAPGLSQTDRAPAAGRYDLSPSSAPGTSVSVTDLEGSELRRTGYQGLAIAEDVTIVALPDLVTVATGADGTFDEELYLAAQGRLVDWCSEGGTRMAILDAPPGLNAVGAVEWRQKLKADSAFGAAYYPNLVVLNPQPPAGATNGDRFRLVPPCGHVAGVWARTDAARGVWKAPANEVVRGVARLETEVTNGEQAKLNPQQVNCIRSFGSGGIRIWGARTLATTDQSWRYINVRRLFNFMEETIRQGTQWVVFEPNDAELWARVRRTVNGFLHGLWMQGALVGATPAQAYFVQCDESNNPRAQVDNGILVVDVGIAPVRPAEFVVFRVSQWQGGEAAE